MSRFDLRIRCVWLALAVGLTIAGIAVSMAAEKDVPGATPPAAVATDENHDRARECKLRHELNRPTTIEFIDEKLGTVLDYLGELHHIEIELDPSVESDAGVGLDTPVTRNLKDVSLRATLRLLLERFQLTFVVRDGVLLIATPEVAAEMTCVRVYDVGDLLQGDKDPEELAELLRTMVVSSPGSTPEPRLVPFVKLLVVNASLPDHDEIVEVLAKMREKLKPAGK